MAVQFGDPGGEHYYSLGVVNGPWWTNVNPIGQITCVSNAPSGRSSQYALQAGYVTGLGARKTFPSSFAGMVAGCAQYWGNGPISAGAVLISFYDSTQGASQLELRCDAGGHLYFTRNTSNLGAGNPTKSANILGVQSWNYIEVKVSFATDATGSAEVRVNGVVWLTLTSVQTANVNASADSVVFSTGPVSASNNYLKDMYCLDTGTGANTTYLGDITLALLYPNGAGVNSAWTANGAASDWQCVDDGSSHSGTWPDGDTTYISDATAGHKADFAHQALSLTGSILAVIAVSYQRKDDAGSRSSANLCLSGGTESDGATQSLGNTYQYYFDVYEKDPHTSAAWTLTGFNNATFGCKLIS